MGEVIAKVIVTALIFYAVIKAIMLGATAFSGSKVNAATSEVSSLVLNVQNTYGIQNSYSSLNNSILARLAPPSIVETDSIANPWGGTLTGGVEPTNSRQFFILSTQVPNDGCAKFAQLASAIKVQINGGPVYGHGNKIDPARAVQECNSPDDNNTIRFVFGQ